MSKLLLYLIYMIMIYCIIKYYKNDNYITLTLIIIIGIYIINFFIPETKENFSKQEPYNPDNKLPGENCKYPADCHSKMCNNKKCSPWRKKGESCKVHRNCLSGHCRNFTCTKIQKVGQSCNSNKECNEYKLDTTTGTSSYDNKNVCGSDSICHKKKKKKN